MKEGRAHAVKLEGGVEFAPHIEAIVKASIPVVAHIGLTPQSVNAFGGFKPKFVKVFADAGKVMREGVAAYIEETRTGVFPAEEHCFKIEDSVIEKLY